jgi:hypothetical protein
MAGKVIIFAVLLVVVIELFSMLFFGHPVPWAGNP